MMLFGSTLQRLSLPFLKDKAAAYHYEIFTPTQSSKLFQVLRQCKLTCMKCVKVRAGLSLVALTKAQEVWVYFPTKGGSESLSECVINSA